MGHKSNNWSKRELRLCEGGNEDGNDDSEGPDFDGYEENPLDVGSILTFVLYEKI